MDPDNALFFLTAQLECYKAITRKDKNFSIFETALTELIREPINKIENNLRFLREDESFKICTDLKGNEIECGNHGHLGANGARGAISGFKKLGTRVNIGHSHSANIADGVYQAGVTGSLDMGYNVGASSWSSSHILTYSNGKRTIITTHNNKAWCLKDTNSGNAKKRKGKEA
jgi:hypothetical protein